MRLSREPPAYVEVKLRSEPNVAAPRSTVPTPPSALPVSGFLTVAIFAFRAWNASLNASAAVEPAVMAG